MLAGSASGGLTSDERERSAPSDTKNTRTPSVVTTSVSVTLGRCEPSTREMLLRRVHEYTPQAEHAAMARAREAATATATRGESVDFVIWVFPAISETHTSDSHVYPETQWSSLVQ